MNENTDNRDNIELSAILGEALQKPTDRDQPTNYESTQNHNIHSNVHQHEFMNKDNNPSHHGNNTNETKQNDAIEPSAPPHDYGHAYRQESELHVQAKDNIVDKMIDKCYEFEFDGKIINLKLKSVSDTQKDTTTPGVGLSAESPSQTNIFNMKYENRIKAMMPQC